MKLNAARIILNSVLLFFSSLLYNGLVHMLILAEANKQMETLKRADFSSKMGISILATFIASLLFSFLYARFVSPKSRTAGLKFGLCFGLFISVMVDLNQYVLYPLPFSLAAKWAFFGIIEFTFLGLITGMTLKEIPLFKNTVPRS